MKMVVIFGPAAVGKMTVGQSLSAITDYPLFHNHVTIEPLLKYFPFDSPAFSRLNKLFREEIIRELSKSHYTGMIFTYMWDLRDPTDAEYLRDLIEKFSSDPSSVAFVELEARQNVRLKRNRTENRLNEKPSKRDVSWSDSNLMTVDQRHVLNTSSKNPFPMKGRHLKIDNSERDPDDVAKEIVRYFDLPQRTK
jgi:adenylate kinase family enzyme